MLPYMAYMDPMVNGIKHESSALVLAAYSLSDPSGRSKFHKENKKHTLECLSWLSFFCFVL